MWPAAFLETVAADPGELQREAQQPGRDPWQRWVPWREDSLIAPVVTVGNSPFFGEFLYKAFGLTGWPLMMTFPLPGLGEDSSACQRNRSATHTWLP